MPADGHCYFHALLNVQLPDYRAGIKSCREQAAQFRSELAALLETTDHATGRRVYDGLLNGGLAMFAFETGCADYTLEGMKQVLNSSKSVGYEFQELISNILRRDIFILVLKDGCLQPYVFETQELNDLLYRNRPALVLFNDGANHFDLVARRSSSPSDSQRGPQGELQVTFAADDPLVLKMRKRIEELKKRAAKLPPLKKEMSSASTSIPCPDARVRVTIDFGTFAPLAKSAAPPAKSAAPTPAAKPTSVVGDAAPTPAAAPAPAAKPTSVVGDAAPTPAAAPAPAAKPTSVVGDAAPTPAAAPAPAAKPTAVMGDATAPAGQSSGLFEPPDSALKMPGVGFKDVVPEADGATSAAGFHDTPESGGTIPAVTGFHDEVDKTKAEHLV
jgi:hypothetical protein